MTVHQQNEPLSDPQQIGCHVSENLVRNWLCADLPRPKDAAFIGDEHLRRNGLGRCEHH
jgi:hypothetical protein